MAKEDITLTDPESGLQVRYTDNGIKEEDPKTYFEELHEPLKLDEDGLPLKEQ